MSMPEADFRNRYVPASDGLRLHFRDYGSPLDPGLPVVCLPGLTRSAPDFAALAGALSCGLAGHRRRVLVIDYRGRGRSDYDPDPGRYSIEVEQDDILSVLASAGVERAAFVGTSRGGIHAMLLAAARPALLAAVVLNDVGPILEPAGLLRIKAYVGRLPAPTTEAAAVALAKKLMGAHFTGLGEADWIAAARATFADDEGRYGQRYDPELSRTTENFDVREAIPVLWPQFDALTDIPLLIVRGANSDLLSPETVTEMMHRHPGAELLVVEGQGHAPLLTDEASIGRIADFIARSC